MSFALNDSSDDSLSPINSRSMYSPFEADDNEIGNLEDQINEMNNFLESVHSHSEERQHRYANEIDKTKQAIEITKVRQQSILDQLIAEQEREVKEVLENQNKEMEEIIRGAANVDKDITNWNEVAKNLNNLRSQNEIFELQKNINRVQTEGKELEFTKTRQSEEQITSRRSIIENQARRIESIQNEIELYQGLLRQDNQNYELISQDHDNARENREKTHTVTMKKLSYETEQREAIFRKHIETIQRQIENEQQRTESDSKALKDTENSLLNLKRATSKKCMAQLSDATHSIEQTQALIEKQASFEGSSTQALNASTMKVRSLQSQNLLLKHKIEQIKCEIDNVQGNIQRGCSELKRAQTPKKTYAPKSTYNSSFH